MKKLLSAEEQQRLADEKDAIFASLPVGLKKMYYDQKKLYEEKKAIQEENRRNGKSYIWGDVPEHPCFLRQFFIDQYNAIPPQASFNFI